MAPDTPAAPLSGSAAAPLVRPHPRTPATGTAGTGARAQAPPVQDVRQVLGAYLRTDVLFALGIITIILFMLIPMPKFMLDAGLAVSITFSITVLMMVLFIRAPLEFSTFPTVLLIATSLRLGLNIASTRLVLQNGHTGSDAAGQIIQAFGELIIQGNYVIGAIVFAILVIVNFVVITRGSGRIAEVAARFALDAMPGKQMAIDADLSAGLINEDEAKTRRAKLESESTFFGAMDGAAKFVRGDAIAGLIIVFVNAVGGIVVGTLTHGLTLAEAASNYTLLTIGDGLVSQVPALIVSVSAGFLVSKAGVEGSADEALGEQFTRYPAALVMAAGLMAVLGAVPGMPIAPFWTLAAITGGLAWLGFQRTSPATEKHAAAQAAAAKAPPAEESPDKALAIDAIRLELGYGLLTLVKGEDGQGGKLPQQIKALRRQMAEEMGYLLPAVRIQDNLQLPAQTYVVKMKEVEVGRGEVQPGMLLCMDPRGGSIGLPGEATVEPTFGLPAMWIAPAVRADALAQGYTVVDAPTVVTTHLTEVVRDAMPDLLSYAEVQKLLDTVPEAYKKLVADLVPAQLPVAAVQAVLRALLSERVSIRDLPTILEGLSEAAAYTRNPQTLTEHARARLARQVCEGLKGPDGVVTLMTLSPAWEAAFTDALVGSGEERQLAMAPSKLQDFITAVREAYARAAETATGGREPALLTSPLARPYVRSVVERFRPQTVVLSQNEIHPKARIRTAGA
ncbi:MAG: flagellar biosynthesis protein FlhA, partial [Alphaproteobacteria bacterium]|nr:flagellar biosynthesis protein FlhA [Alphaproteobacteria bacterium]